MNLIPRLRTLRVVPQSKAVSSAALSHGYRIFGIGVDRRHKLKRLFPQEKATFHSSVKSLRVFRKCFQFGPLCGNSTTRSASWISPCSIYDDADGQHNVILNRQTTSLGRLADQDIVFHQQCVSRRHAKIIREGDSWSVVDENSSHGTFVNGSRARVPRAQIRRPAAPRIYRGTRTTLPIRRSECRGPPAPVCGIENGAMVFVVEGVSAPCRHRTRAGPADGAVELAAQRGAATERGRRH